VTNGVWHQWYNDYKLTAHNSHGVFPITLEDERRYFQEGKSNSRISLAVCSLNDDSVIGTVSLLSIDLLNRKAEIACTIGINICPSAGLECLGLMIQHGMDRLNLNKIYGGAHQGLHVWVKMLSSLGFVEEGKLREESLRNGKYTDVIKFGLLSREYEKLVVEREGKYLMSSSGALYKAALSHISSH
jgi:RimJ/RimL family protein N-acetyltransferase